MIDKRAVVHRGAEIASDVEIGPFSVIGEQVQIDAGTWIGPHVVINGPTRIGRGNRIFQFASIGEGPQDKKYSGEPTRLEIGDDNTIREYVSIHRGTTGDRGVTTIGDRNWIMAYVHIAHDCILGNDTVLSNCATLAGHVEVHDHVILGGFSKLHQFTRVGAYAFCSMDNAIKHDVPPYVMADGNPAVPKGLNSVGLRRHGFTPDQILNIRRAYKTLYRSGLKLDAAIDELRGRAAGLPELERFVEFLASAKRSIIR